MRPGFQIHQKSGNVHYYTYLYPILLCFDNDIIIPIGFCDNVFVKAFLQSCVMPIPGIRENLFLWRGRFCILIVTGKILSNNLRGVEDHEWRSSFRRQGEPARPD